ncbi:MAG: MFS transporter [Agarilytica sp.]
MLGLFMVLPVLMLYGSDYAGASPMLLGLALGIYGFTQACFQIPLGLLSDLIGRKPVIIAGLVLFALGSVVAAMAESVEALILGRALQGSGAIASAIMAMVADLTSEENRTKAMAAIGASIGLSFSVAMILGPALAAAWGLGGVFVLSAVLSGIGIAIVLFIVPTPQNKNAHRDVATTPALFLRTARNIELLRLDWGIFALHAILMACFVSVPELLETTLGLAREKHWMFYLPVLFLAFLGMLPLMIFAEKRRQIKPVFLLAISLIGLSSALLFLYYQNAYVFVTLMLVFFLAFNLLESMLPSLVSKIAPAGTKGTAMGIYSTSQFLGAFIGGLAGGWVAQYNSSADVFMLVVGLALVWVAIAFGMTPPQHLSRVCLAFQQEGDFSGAGDIDGVEELFFSEEESLLYMKIDKRCLDLEGFEALRSKSLRLSEQATAKECELKANPAV